MLLKSEPLIHLRAYEPGSDLAFVRDAWIRSGEYVAKQSLGRWFRKGLYYETQRDLVTRLLEECETVVACDAANRRVVVAFACGLPDRYAAPVLHFVYCKADFRRFGVAPQCLAAIGVHRKTRVICTAWTDWCEEENRKRAEAGEPQMRYNPYLVGVSNGGTRPTESATVRDDPDLATDRPSGEPERFFHSWLDRESGRRAGQL